MTIWVSSRNEFSELVASIAQYSEIIENTLIKKSSVKGYCHACDRITDLRITLGEPEGEWRNLLEGMVCECGMNGRLRLILTVLDEILLTNKYKLSAVLERLTPLFSHLEKRLTGLIGSEYLGNKVLPGSVMDKNGIPVRSESMMSLTYESETLDLIMHFDVLEHVPDWQKGLKECFRVLKQGGTMMFTCPFYHNLEKNICRAKIVDDEINYILPKAYHGNPLSVEGSLVYIHPSWEIFEFLKSMGFASVKIAVFYDPIQGVVSCGCPFPDGHVWPVVFVATK